MKKIIIILTTLMVVGLCGCEKYLDINDDPNVPTIAEPSKLLTGAQVSLGQIFSQDNFIGNGMLSYVHQLVSRENAQYNMLASGTMGNTWWWAYANVKTNLDELISTSEENGNLYYAGIAKLLNAYTFSVMVDIWGSIPYSENNVPGIIHPKIDTDTEIYNSLISQIDDAIANLNDPDASNIQRPGNDDLIYGGNIAKWKRLANTLKLRLLLNSRLTPEVITNYSTHLSELIAANNFILDGEDFEFWFNEMIAPDQRHPAFIDEYTGGQTTYYISPWFYEIMRGLTFNATNNPFAGIDDPRVPYYWVNQLVTGEAAQNPHEYRHENFVSIVFGSIGPYSDGAQRYSATMIGLYPCGGKYDDGVGSDGPTGFTGADGSGIAPQKFITYASLQFMLAELAINGEIAANAKDLYEQGVRAAFGHVNKVVAESSSAPSISSAAIDSHVSSLLTAYDAAPSDERRFEMIMTQKWISNFFNPVECYADYRRTGYPVLFDPIGSNGEVVIPVDNNGIQSTSPVQLIRKYPKSFWYPQREVELNPNIDQKSDLSESRIFWDTRSYDY